MYYQSWAHQSLIIPPLSPGTLQILKMINKREQTQTKQKRQHRLLHCCVSLNAAHEHRSTLACDRSPLRLTGRRLYSGHVLRRVSPWSNSERQLLELWLLPATTFTARTRQSRYMQRLSVHDPAAHLCLPSCPADPSTGAGRGKELAYLAFSPSRSTHTQPQSRDDKR